jgi:osmoprotectant transport system ATP-binding protein
LSDSDIAQTEGPPARRRAAEIVFSAATKRYPGRDRDAVSKLSFTIAPGEICMLVGPSGAGKTTALKLINRLIELDEGDITIDGRSVRSLPTVELRRGIGYVIQQVGLFPHMTVAANIATVPRLLGWDRARIRTRTAELLELVGLDPTADAGRYPSQLSGGQRQRVGLARAMAADPPLMLMDEPFGALDPITRERLQNEFLRLQREIGKTVVFVTHDVDEAILMGDKVAVLREGGVLAQFDSPDAILAHPEDDFVAQFVGADRGLKRLSLRRVSDVRLLPAPSVGVGVDADAARRVASADGAVVLVDESNRPLGLVDVEGLEGRVEASAARPLGLVGRPEMPLDDALSLMLSQADGNLVVVDADGRLAGVLSAELISAVLSDGHTAGREVTR